MENHTQVYPILQVLLLWNRSDSLHYEPQVGTFETDCSAKKPPVFRQLH